MSEYLNTRRRRTKFAVGYYYVQGRYIWLRLLPQR